MKKNKILKLCIVNIVCAFAIVPVTLAAASCGNATTIKVFEVLNNPLSGLTESSFEWQIANDKITITVKDIESQQKCYYSSYSQSYITYFQTTLVPPSGQYMLDGTGIVYALLGSILIHSWDK